MVELARELKDLGLRPRQVQDFTPTPMTLSTAQHLAGRDPLTNQALHTVRGDKARGDQRALLQWFLPAYRKRAKRLLQSLKATDLTRAPSTRPRRGTDRRRRPSR
jgi:hypothetical protein